MTPAQAFQMGIEAAAKVCDEYEIRHWKAYKTGNGPERASRYVEGESDAAGDLASAIRKLPNPFAGEDQRGAAAGDSAKPVAAVAKSEAVREVCGTDTGPQSAPHHETAAGQELTEAHPPCTGASEPAAAHLPGWIQQEIDGYADKFFHGYLLAWYLADLERIARLAIASKGEGK